MITQLWLGASFSEFLFKVATTVSVFTKLNLLSINVELSILLLIDSIYGEDR